MSDPKVSASATPRKRGPKPKPPEERFRALVDTSAGPDGCHPFMGHRLHGHGQFNRGNRVLVYAHRYALELHLGRPLLDGMSVLHKPLICHNRACCNPAHLYEGDDAQNTRDRATDGTMPQGETHWNRRLTEAEIPVILALFWWSGFTDQEIADEYGLARTGISSVVHRRRWKHVRWGGDLTRPPA